MRGLVIAIDGPSGSGKGVLARKLSERLNIAYLDSGLLYRAVAFKLIKAGCPLDNRSEAAKIALNLNLNDIREPALKSDEIAGAASKIAGFAEVRAALLPFQVNFVKKAVTDRAGAVLDGRDIGTQVLPDANFKIYLTANLETRAQRRHKELQERGMKSIYDQVLEDMRERDERDSKRVESPLKPAQDAYVIDSSAMEIDEVIDHAVRYIYEHKAASIG